MSRWALLTAFMLCAVARADFVPDAGQRDVDVPPDRNGPVPVTVDFFLLDVTAVNGATETFTASLYYDLKWKDSRVAFDAGKFGANRSIFDGDLAEDQAAKIWTPDVVVSNLVEDPQSLQRTLTIHADGAVEYEVRLIGELTSPMELSRFPFDSQNLLVQLESFVWSSDEMQLLVARDSDQFDTDLTIRDWTILNVASDVAVERYVTGDEYSRFTSTIFVQRQPWFYVWGVFFPLVLVTFFGFLCFFWDQDTVTERVAQALACLLTVTAQSLAVSGDLPKISYFTRIDYAFLLTYIVLLIVAAESIWVRYLNERNRELADRVDLRAVWTVSVCYVIGMSLVVLIP